MAWGYGQASNATVRDLATVGVGGEAIRVRISNVFGDASLVIAAASVGLSASRSAVVRGRLRTLRFNRAGGAKVPVGGVVYSDPALTRVAAMQTLAISVLHERPQARHRASVLRKDRLPLHPERRRNRDRLGERCWARHREPLGALGGRRRCPTNDG